MEDDDIDDLAPGPDVESFSTETSGRRIADAMAAKDMVADVVNEDGVSVEPPASHTSAGLHPRAELQASMVGEEEHAAAVSDGGRTPAEPPSPRMQLRLQLLLCNRDAPGSPPMTYQYVRRGETEPGVRNTFHERDCMGLSAEKKGDDVALREEEKRLGKLFLREGSGPREGETGDVRRVRETGGSSFGKAPDLPLRGGAQGCAGDTRAGDARVGLATRGERKERRKRRERETEEIVRVGPCLFSGPLAHTRVSPAAFVCSPHEQASGCIRSRFKCGAG
eukprot:365742-Chlamydomonas_euryale.AAC.2